MECQLKKRKIGIEVRQFYLTLPFNYSSDPILDCQSIRSFDPLISYSCLKPLIKPALTVLDLGCGVGHFVNAMAYHHKINVTGVDFNPVALKRAQEVARLLGVCPNLVESDLFNFMPQHRFDLVTSIGVLHHTHSYKAGIEHICKNCVEPNGSIFIGLYHKYGRKPFLDHFKSLKSRGLSPEALKGEYAELNPGHTDQSHLQSWYLDQVEHPYETHHTLEELNSLLEPLDFSITATSINGFKHFSQIESLFEEERLLYKIARERLEKRQYYPGFFLILAKNLAQLNQSNTAN